VPLVTLSGNIEMGCMGKSKLLRLNMHELIAYNKEDYVQIAINLAHDVDKIQKFNTELRGLALKTIFNGKNHVNELESAYRQMWRTYCIKK